MTAKRNCKKRLSLAGLLIIIFTSTSFAQLKADFAIDKNGGCSPLTVSFTNTTTGASSSATYQWDLGNGNTSSLMNAGATYVVEQSYSITLTVTDGSKSSSQTKQIAVYKRPTVDFSFDVAKGCLPLPVNFTATAMPGDGSIANYYWDFGDGSTQQISLPQIQHTYNFAENSNVGLTVTNSYGCYTSVQKSAVQVLGAIQSSFTVDKTVLCNISDPVQFTNTSSGPGTSIYAWDFGDGNTSSTINPSHVYNKKGKYSVSLMVSSSDGCKISSTQSTYINVRNFNTDFDVPAPICENTSATFIDKSSPVSGNSIWIVDNQIACYYCYGSFTYTFTDLQDHKIQLVNTYGTCADTATKTVSVKSLPDIKPFVINIPSYCNTPVTVSFKDTTSGAVAWSWELYQAYSINQPFSTVQSTSYTFASPDWDYVYLTVKNAAGCIATETQSVIINNTGAYINVNADYLNDCDSLSASFFVVPNKDSIVSFQWNFGDGTTSNVAQPQHVYEQPGNYSVTLNFITNTGCNGSSSTGPIQVYKRPKADFSVSGSTTICGNTPTTFINQTNGPITQWQWDFGNGNNYIGYGYNATNQFLDSGYYTVKLIASNGSYSCADTITKTNYIEVLPPFPKISSVTNTCDGTRGLVKFTESSKYVQNWQWNFGDGNNSPLYSTKQDTITHSYNSTGTYSVVLSTTNAQCTVKDSVIVYVLLKQNPILSSPTSAICENTPMDIKVSNMQTNPGYAYYSYYNTYYFLAGAQYGDSSNYGSYIPLVNYNTYFLNSGEFTVPYLNPLKTNFRVITQSVYFGCYDTSNFIPLKINGPKAAFKIVEGSPCFQYPVILQDSSIAGSNSKIARWDWDFYDATGITTQYISGSIAHVYSSPGQYYVDLKVTDADGCSDVASNYVNPSGPESAFTYSPANVTPNSPVTFFNNTNVFNSGNTQYKWIFGDGSTSTDFSPSHVYSTTSVDTVKLIAINPDTHCQDTIIQIINVKIINTQFSFSKTYVSANTCPPVIVHFTNTSSNALSVAWDFGDGSKADNQNNPSHTYYNAGTYKVTMYGYGYNGTTDTTVDSIIVKAPFAKLGADAYFGCLSKTITLNAQIQNASSFIWDFGDGTIKQTKDSFSTHSYLSPGIYSPALIMTDSNGCSLLSYLDQKVVIDSLAIKINKSPLKLCGPGMITFSDPVITSFAEQMQQPLQYHWDFGTGNIADTSDDSSPSFTYNRYGTSYMNVTVQSPYGCVKHAADSIIVVPKAIASISGPTEICANASAQFNGFSTLTDTVIWRWDFGNGNISSSQNPSKQIFTDAKAYNVTLIINHFGCYDTAYDNIVVHPNPNINLSPKQSVVCLGNSVQLNANGGIHYLWSPASGLNDSKSATPIATPINDVIYIVQATNEFNCSSIDSANITVAKPFKVKIPADTFVCRGSSILLLASGADSYNWIGGDGLSSTIISNPIATPASATSFTVVGYDAYQCFTDTETVHINVEPIPTVDAGPDINALTGTIIQLNAIASSDVTQWNWAPSDNLSCSDCSSPIATPNGTTAYVVTVKNKYDCAAYDTVVIKLTCDEGKVYVPSAFTPDNNGKNDVFYIKGKGVRIIKSFQVFGRWGEIVFEKKNINIDDRSSAWDGNYKGQPAPTGTYVYVAELICDTGQPFVVKGTVVLVR
jgi:gliding motility-associated-like protein